MRDTPGGLGGTVDADHHGTFDPGTDDVAIAVMNTVASAKDVTPMDLAPLTTAVDPDALSALFSDTPDGPRISDGELVFTHEGCEVTVTSGGDIWARSTG